MLEFYFVVTARSTLEIEVVQELQPPNILISYFYFRNRNLKEFIKEIGYRPRIMLDSGAFSAKNTGRNIALLDYMDYIQENKEHIFTYVSLDAIGDPDVTFAYYEIMRMKGFNPIPVFHYNSNNNYLEQYLNVGERYIALGGTVYEKSKETVAIWIRLLTMQYPRLDFHLLGSSSRKILNTCNLFSCDSSTWMIWP